ncbi:MAG TPA: cupin domain-containing protein [Edaphobacter sp.]|nr:cupin domain-containing protein [Edaphobacter sp.]
MGSKPNDSLVHPIAAEDVRDLSEIPVRGFSEPKAQSTIRVVHPAELSTETPQTPGSLRMSAIAATHGIVSSIWAGVFVVEPLGKTGIHHHGEQDTVVYVLGGEACVRWGKFGEHSVTVRAGDFLHVPGWLPHQELNPSKEHPFRWVVVRSTPEPIVVNLPDNFWTPTDPKWMSKGRPSSTHTPNFQHERKHPYE